MDTIHKRLLASAHVLRHRLIGCQHTLLHNGLTQIADTLFKPYSPAIFVQLHLYLRYLEVNSPPSMTIAIHGIAHLFQIIKKWQNILIILTEILIPVYQNLVYQGIRQTAVYMNHHRQNLVFGHLALRADFHFTGHGQAVHPCIKAANAIGKLPWKHRHHTVHKVHRSTSGLSLNVQWLIFPHIPAYVRYINTKEKATVIVLFHVDAIIKVLGILTVNGDNFKMSTVLTAIFTNMLLSIYGLLHSIGGLLYHLREGLRQVVLPHNGKNIHSRCISLSQYLHNMALSLFASLWPLGNLHNNLVPGFGPQKLP